MEDNINIGLIKDDIIKDNIIEWTEKYLDKNFEFREHQLETIIGIISNILNHGNHNHVVEAPTGSGKSLINIISACVLAEYYNMTSYILVSDLFLWEQYYNFLENHKRIKIGVMKGKRGNYTCLKNGLDITLAECMQCGLSWTSMYNKNVREKYGFQCAETCQYVLQRKKAVKSKVCLMTYQLFIQTFKMINPDENNPYQFKYRDILFCDECHNIPSIVETRVHAHMKEKDLDVLLSIYDYAKEKNQVFFKKEFDDDPIYSDFFENTSRQDVINEFNEIWNTLSNPETRQDEDNIYTAKWHLMLTKFSDICSNIRDSLFLKKSNGIKFTKEDLEMFGITNWFWDYALEFGEYYGLIDFCGNEYQLKEICQSTAKDEGPTVIFRCLKEDYLVYKYLLNKPNYKVMLSATVGGHESFDENMGFIYTEDKESKMDRVPSTFNFDESPVWFLNKFKMSLKERDISFTRLKPIIYSICSTKFNNQRGLIQTGSYKIAKDLYNNAPYNIKKRMLLYNGSHEKKTMIDIHQISDDTILVGPTLNEGIDLPGDQCRFIIILKCPYPNLGDRYVKEKIKYFPLWYNASTSNNIIQGIGRGIRYNGDWCVTYIFDGCFWNLYKSTIEQYPQELQERIKFI